MKTKQNFELLEGLLRLPGVTVKHTTNETARINNDLMLALKHKGKPIPTHDIWIAACAIETGSVIVTFDKYYLYIDQARVWGNVEFRIF